MKSLWQFLGMVNFYRRFISNCTSILQPLTNLLTNIKKYDIVVSGDAQSAFSKIKAALTKTTELSHVFPGVELCLAVDASAVGVEIVLQEKVSGSWKPISFYSQKLTNTEKRYNTIGREFIPLSQLFVTWGIFGGGGDFTSSPTTNYLLAHSGRIWRNIS